MHDYDDFFRVCTNVFIWCNNFNEIFRHSLLLLRLAVNGKCNRFRCIWKLLVFLWWTKHWQAESSEANAGFGKRFGGHSQDKAENGRVSIFFNASFHLPNNLNGFFFSFFLQRLLWIRLCKKSQFNWTNCNKYSFWCFVWSLTFFDNTIGVHKMPIKSNDSLSLNGVWV